jgi:ankyrin repeat protein
VVQQLVAAGAQLDAADRPYERTPLHTAADAGCPTLVAALLAAGADPGSTTPKGYTVLHAAASSGSLVVVQQVLGALGPNRAAALLNPEQGAVSQPPPLHYAAGTGVVEVVRELVAAGADVEQQYMCPLVRTISTALDGAFLGSHFHLVPLLFTPGIAQKSHPLLSLARAARRHPDLPEGPWAAAAAKAATALLAGGANTSVKSKEGLTPVETAAAWGHPAVLQVLLEHELLQQPRQQQQAEGVSAAAAAPAGSSQPLLALFQKLGAHALSHGDGHTWRLLLTLAADAWGQAGVHTLWRDIKQQLQQTRLESGPLRLRYLPDRPRTVLRAWFECWAAACKGLAAQEVGMVQRLQQLVVLPQQHQRQHQQQPRAASKQPRLARELRMLSSTTTAAAGAAAGAGGAVGRSGTAPNFWHGSSSGVCSSSSGGGGGSCSSRAARAEARHLGAEASQRRELEAAAARGDESRVRAALGQLSDRGKGLLAACVAAGAAGHWGLCMGLLRELVMLDEAKGREGPAPGRDDVSHLVAAFLRLATQLAPQQQQQQQQEVVEHPVEATRPAENRLQQEAITHLQAVYPVCDVLLADWLVLRQQQQRELRDAVVAAVTVAAG